MNQTLKKQWFIIDLLWDHKSQMLYLTISEFPTLVQSTVMIMLMVPRNS